MKRRNILLLLAVGFSIIFLSSVAEASLNDDLTSYFDGLGFSANVSDPQAYHGQQAGFYTLRAHIAYKNEEILLVF